MNDIPRTTRRRECAKPVRTRNGTALLICLFVMTIASLSVLGVLNSVTSQMAAHRNTLEYEKALYLAGAGVHHAIAELEADPSWTTGIPNTPSSGSEYYSATLSPQGDGSIIITGVGVAGSVTRRLEVTVDFSG